MQFLCVQRQGKQEMDPPIASNDLSVLRTDLGFLLLCPQDIHTDEWDVICDASEKSPSPGKQVKSQGLLIRDLPVV